jgi:pilus assembly protein Flp/PilA
VFEGSVSVAVVTTSRTFLGNALVGRQVKKRTVMKKFADSVKKFIVSEDGPTAVEYAVMMALIIVVCIGTITTVGTNAKAKFSSVKDALS